MNATPSCPYCGDRAALVTGGDIYPHRSDLEAMKFWRCAPCGAYVGCHKTGDGTRQLGRLANAELRAAKIRAHAAFDPLWQTGRMKRRAAYRWLADQMGVERAHIAEFDLDACRRVVKTCESFSLQVGRE